MLNGACLISPSYGCCERECAMSKQIEIDKGYSKDGALFLFHWKCFRCLILKDYKDESIMWNPSVSLKKSFKMLFFASHLSDNVKKRWLRQSFQSLPKSAQST